MLNLKPVIYNLLKQTGIEVTYFYPQSNESLPLISYFEVSNVEIARVGFKEALTEFVYQIDVWAMKPSECSDIAIQIDELMRTNGFRRQFSTDMFEQDTNIHHKSLRYRGVVDNKTLIIYQ